MATQRKSATRLKKSKLQNLYRHQNGMYYARVKVNGKSKERSLRTNDSNLAPILLPETINELRGACNEHQAGTLAVAINAEAYRDDADLEESTQHYSQQISKSIIQGLPQNIASKKHSQVAVGDLRTWRDAIRQGSQSKSS